VHKRQIRSVNTAILAIPIGDGIDGIGYVGIVFNNHGRIRV